MMRRLKQAVSVTLVGLGVAVSLISIAPEARAAGGTYWDSYPTYDECHTAAVEGRRAGEWYRYFCYDKGDHWDLYIK